MALMMVAGAQTSVVLFVLLLVAIGLTVWETRDQGLDRRSSTWWILLVVMIHVPGYLALRVFGLIRSRNETP